MKTKIYKIVLFSLFLILINSCQYTVSEIDLDLDKMCVTAKKGYFSEVNLISTKDNDTTYRSYSCSLFANSNTICFNKQVDSLISEGADEFSIYFRLNDNTGEHLFQYGFRTNDRHHLSGDITIKEIIE